MKNLEIPTKNNIWDYRQNKPHYIVEDIIKKYPNVDPSIIYSILLKRGVFKWFSVRRLLIKLKHNWKKEIAELNKNKKIPYLKGFLKGIMKCSKEVNELCHSERWQAPDNDTKAQKYLKKQEKIANRKYTIYY